MGLAAVPQGDGGTVRNTFLHRDKLGCYSERLGSGYCLECAKGGGCLCTLGCSLWR